MANPVAYHLVDRMPEATVPAVNFRELSRTLQGWGGNLKALPLRDAAGFLTMRDLIEEKAPLVWMVQYRAPKRKDKEEEVIRVLVSGEEDALDPEEGGDRCGLD
jgi:hypothetical protein